MLETEEHENLAKAIDDLYNSIGNLKDFIEDEDRESLENAYYFVSQARLVVGEFKKAYPRC